MSKRKVHMRSTRYYVNAGINLPLCYARQQGPLDLDKTGLPTSGDPEAVTCKHCQREYQNRGS